MQSFDKYNLITFPRLLHIHPCFMHKFYLLLIHHFIFTCSTKIWLLYIYMLILLSTIIYSYFLRKIYSLLRSNHFTTTDPLIINTNETKLCLQPTPVLSSRSAAITERSVPLIVLLLIRDRFHANASLELALEPRIDASSSRVHHAAVKEGRGWDGKNGWATGF